MGNTKLSRPIFNIHDKIYSAKQLFQEAYSNVLYYMHVLVVKYLLLDIAVVISNINRKFYINNLAHLFCGLKCVTIKGVDYLKEFHSLYIFLLEEFFYIAIYEQHDALYDDALKKIEIIGKFAASLGYYDIFKGIDTDFALLIRSKNDDDIRLQFTYMCHVWCTSVFGLKLENSHIYITKSINLIPAFNHNGIFEPYSFDDVLPQKIFYEVCVCMLSSINLAKQYYNNSFNDHKIELCTLINSYFNYFILENKYYSRNNAQIIQNYFNETCNKKKYNIIIEK
jgi:hypothetical protein